MPTTREQADFEELVTVEELTPEEAEEVFDRVARSTLGISGEEFRRKWEAGEYVDSDDMAVTRLYMLMPSAR